MCRRYAHFLLCDVITTQYHRPIIQGFVIVRRVLDELCNSWSVSRSRFAVRLAVSVAVNGFPEVMEFRSMLLKCSQISCDKAAIRVVQLPYSLISWCDTNLSGARYSSCMWAKLVFFVQCPLRYTCQNPKTRMMYFEVFLVFETCLCI